MKNLLQNVLYALFNVLCQTFENKVAIVEVPKTRNSPAMAKTINNAAGREVCHYSFALGRIIADDPDSLKKLIWEQWFASSTKIIYLGA